MTLVTLERITRAFTAEPVLADLSLRVDERDRIGVVGDNGAGKTTMIRILAGVDEPDSGARNPRKDLRIAYGEQLPDLPPGTTVLDWVRTGNGEHEAIERRFRALEAALARDPHDAAALADYGHLHAQFEAGGGYERLHRVEQVLDGLGFGAQDRQKDLAVLSGGERSRVQLAVLMTTPADLLILDEPTNHLDLAGIEFVEDFVQRYPGACVVISHDRAFLDRVATSLVVVADGGARRYKGNYTHYARQRDLELLSEARQFKNQREFIDKEMDYIRRNMAGRNSAQAKGRLKRLQRIQLVEAPTAQRRSLRLGLGDAKGLHGQTVLEAEGLGLRVGDRWLLRDGEFRVQFCEVVALLGRNGAGKTTLLRVLAEQAQPAAGKLARARNLRVGFFAQDQVDLPRHGTVLDALRELDRTIDERELRDHLAHFLFCGDDVDKPVAELSGGEQQRLALARLVRAQFDLLCMDEPTNHLDIDGTEGLERALIDYPGTVVLISHDRRLVQAVADRVLWLADGRIRSFERGLDHCLAVLAAERAEARAASAAPRAETTAAAPAKAIETGKIRNPLLFQKLEERIFALEERLAGVRAAMMEPDNYGSVANMKELQQQEAELVATLAEAYAQWENWQ